MTRAMAKTPIGDVATGKHAFNGEAGTSWPLIGRVIGGPNVASSEASVASTTAPVTVCMHIEISLHQ